LEKRDPKKATKVKTTLGKIEKDPHYPSLQSHKYESMQGPNGEDVWESYVENKTPAAFRVFWCHKKGARGVITIVAITRHP